MSDKDLKPLKNIGVSDLRARRCRDHWRIEFLIGDIVAARAYVTEAIILSSKSPVRDLRNRLVRAFNNLGKE